MPLLKAEQPHWSFSSYDRLPIFAALLLTISSRSTAFLYSRDQNWTQYSKCGLKITEQRGITTSLSLMIVSLLIQPSILLAFFYTAAHCSLKLNLLSTRTLNIFHWTASQTSTSQPVLHPWIMFPLVQVFTFVLVELHRIHFSFLKVYSFCQSLLQWNKAELQKLVLNLLTWWMCVMFYLQLQFAKHFWGSLHFFVICSNLYCIGRILYSW